MPDAPAAWEKGTLQHLLTHTSGIPGFTDRPDYGTWKLSPESTAQTVAHFRDRPLEFGPGEKYRYSNSGYVLLGYVIERVSGKSYDDFVRENIPQPLGMNDSGYDSNTAVIPQRAAGYVPGPHGLTNAPYIDRHIPHSAGGLYATTGDLLRWTQGLFGGKLLSAASLEKMTTPHQGGYGFGLFVRTAGGRQVIDHGGGIEGFNAQLAYDPESKLTVVALANVNGATPETLASQLAAVAFREPVTLPAERKEIQLPASTLQAVVGVYELAPRITITIRLVDGGLTTQLTGQAAYPIHAESEMKFFLKVVDAQIEFFKDAKDAVMKLLLHQGGRDIEAPRKGT